MIRFYLLLAVLGFIGCSDTTIPNDILKPEKMQAVYWDYLRADIMANEYVKKDSSQNDSVQNARLQLQVFKLHNITKEQFYKSYEYYLNHRELMKEMLDTMQVRQKVKEDKPADSVPSRKTDTSKTALPAKILTPQ